jgi:succinate-semialdehyde dehydrogenase / glutarate-semialdehyde dehydrogenase
MHRGLARSSARPVEAFANEKRPIPMSPQPTDLDAPLCLYIDGQFLDGDDRETAEVRDPGTGQLLGLLPLATTDDLDRALKAAEVALRSWRQSSPMDRSRILRAVASLARTRAPQIGASITREMGKPIAEAIAEVMNCADHSDWHAEECRRTYGRVIPARFGNVRQLVLYEPVGVCAAFTPWNFPFNQAIRKISAAVAAGCTIVIKGPEEAPSPVLAIARLFHEAGLPPGVLNLVWGRPAEVSRHLIESPITRKVSFTGSVPVGKQLASMAGAHMKRVTMELGGHAPVIVAHDADVERAADLLASWKFRNAGQVCVSPTRFFLHEAIQDRFLTRFVEQVRAIRVGHGLEAATKMGPLAHGRRTQAMEDLVRDAVTHGAAVEHGGARLEAGSNYFAPTVLSRVPDGAQVMTSEPFGPVAACTTFREVDEVILRSNALPYGLAAYAFTTSTRTALAIQNGIEAGMVSINHIGVGLAETPFGGMKDSGFGSEGGAESLQGYLTTKFVTQMD